ncbi:MAG: ATP-binding protein [Pseudomonadota bacterium]
MTTEPQHDTQQLERAFAAFTQHSAQLESAFNGLRDRVGQLNMQLEQANDDRVRELREKEALADRLSRLLGALPAGVLVCNTAGKIIECNEQALAFLGTPLIGIALNTAFDRADRNLDDGELVLRDGTRLSVSRRRLGPMNGVGPDESVVLLSDVTETRLIQSNLERKQRLTEMGEMAARLAHQIRTPLSSALLYSSQLKRAQVDDDRRRAYAQRIADRLNQVERMVGDMLGYASGKQVINQLVPLSELFSDVKALLEPHIRPDDRVISRIENDADLIHGNRDALLGALANLGCNALQVSKPGVKLQFIASRPDAQTLILAVEDDGPGMTARQAARIFDAFFTTRSDGTGLGLAVVKSTAEAHGGCVRIETAPGAGCRIEMHLTMARSERSQPLSQSTKDMICA